MPDEPHHRHAGWTKGDFAFVASEIGREFPGVSAAQITTAVQEAARGTRAGLGRVELTKATRRVLRGR